MTAKKSSALSKYRVSRSRERLKAAEILLKAGSFSDSLSRSYYAMLFAARALLATKSLDSRKHTGVISLFNQRFVKEGIVDKRLGRMIAEAKGIREESDYGDYVTFTREEAQDQIDNAKLFIQEVARALNKKLDLS